jgi:hypothetical protein
MECAHGRRGDLSARGWRGGGFRLLWTWTWIATALLAAAVSPSSNGAKARVVEPGPFAFLEPIVTASRSPARKKNPPPVVRAKVESSHARLHCALRSGGRIYGLREVNGADRAGFGSVLRRAQPETNLAAVGGSWEGRLSAWRPVASKNA